MKVNSDQFRAVWSASEDDALTSLAESGQYSYIEMSTVLKRQPTSIAARMKALGLQYKYDYVIDLVGGANFSDKLVEKPTAELLHKNGTEVWYES